MFNDLSSLVSGVIISMLASNVDRGFEHQPGQTKEYKIGICCFFEKHASLRNKGKDLAGLKSEECVQVGRHIYLWGVVLVR